MAKPKLRIWRETTQRFNGVIAGEAVAFGPDNWIFGDNEAAVWFDDEDCNYHYIAIDGMRGEEHDEGACFRIATGVMPEHGVGARCTKCGQRKKAR